MSDHTHPTEAHRPELNEAFRTSNERIDDAMTFLQVYAGPKSDGQLDAAVTLVCSEIGRLTRERDSAREALRVSEARVREHWPERDRLRAALEEVKRCLPGTLDRLPELRERIGRALSGDHSAHETNCDAEDAAKWRAFRNCARLRVIGGAGFSDNSTYRFLTLEMWTEYPGATTTPETAELVEKFVSVARSLQSPSKAGERP